MGGADPGDVQIVVDYDKRVRALSDVVCKDITELYQMGEQLGEGRFSTVHAGTAAGTGKRFALKVVENKSLADEENLEALEQEVRILRMLEHPYVVKLKEVVMANESTYLCMELLSGGELFGKIVEAGAFPEAPAATLFAKLLIGVEFLHSKDVVHRDLKPENVLFGARAAHGAPPTHPPTLGGVRAARALRGVRCATDAAVRPRPDARAARARAHSPALGARRLCRAETGSGSMPTDIKIIDFGYAGVWTAAKQLSGLCGTPDYVSPEVLSWYDEDTTPGRPYGKSSDVWSLGVLLYVLLSGCSPFAADDEEELLKLVAKAQFSFPDKEWTKVSDAAKDAVRRCLTVDEAQRITLAQLKEHEWCKEAVQAVELELKQSGALNPRGKGGAAAGADAGDKQQCCCTVQ